MTTTIKYTNSDGVLVSLEQSERLKFYNKETYNNGLLKKIEKFAPKNRNSDEIILTRVDYYLDSGEVFEDVIDQYVSVLRRFVIFYNKQINSNGEVYYECLNYFNGNIESKERFVFNNEGLCIASCKLDLNSNEVYKQMKYFYGDTNIYPRDNYNIPSLVVYYENNDVDYIYDANGYDYELSDFFASSISTDFIWNDYPYYHNFMPMLPEDITV
ncbi:hypothetical protein Q763_02685 [Flavobacterium beibuense F44-8]|uniref:Uncharacterized protein n=1 Tax=Flavobacterium beibuense F44-8 TaxID=1406840 RepID=A0A0A2LVY6_9FLAO|nr:hypothetical protein [Flavobacterium beibuense]KGO83491.1 hypothetical protein Q763_02685 [Flavobacterium beibuense F44-8]